MSGIVQAASPSTESSPAAAASPPTPFVVRRSGAHYAALLADIDAYLEAAECGEPVLATRPETPAMRVVGVFRSADGGSAIVVMERSSAAAPGREAGGPAALFALSPLSALSRREREVSELLARGYSNKEIVATLGISPHTARRHTERVMAKLKVHSRGQIAAMLLRGANVQD